jgi:hypothetical protein
MEESRGAYRVIVGKSEGRRSLRRQGIIIKWIFEKWDGGHGLAQDSNR